MPSKAVSAYMAEIGRKGGEATGKRKRRSRAHYRAAAAKRWDKAECAGCGFAHAKDYKDCVWLKNPY
jgi:general stress protein YciG